MTERPKLPVIPSLYYTEEKFTFTAEYLVITVIMHHPVFLQLYFDSPCNISLYYIVKVLA